MQTYQLGLAALLYDIGKFWQRANEGQQLPPGYAEFDQADYVAWSAAYVERYLPQEAENIRAAFFSAQPDDSPHAARINLADRLAAGESADETQAQSQQCRSIFSTLAGAEALQYLPLKALQLNEAVLFPQTQALDEQAIKLAYTELWNAFAAESENLAAIQDLPTLFNTLYYLLSSYTWAVPSAYYRNQLDISLFDHSRVRAALAVCLADISDETVERLVADPKDEQHPVAYLLEGDISGVQKFIYTITARGAARGLRGRSFYLQILTDAIARYILRWLNLPPSNLIYAGGGHFYLLIPPQAIEQIRSIQQALDHLMLEYHQGDLFVGLGYATLTAADFQRENFSKKWGEASQKVNEAKRRRFAALPPEELYKAVFTPRGHGGNEERECQVCHYEGDDVIAEPRDDEDDTLIRKCALCRSLERLGHDLRNVAQLALIEIEPQVASPRTFTGILSRFGLALLARKSGEDWRVQNFAHRNTPAQRVILFGLEQLPSLQEQIALEQLLGSPVAGGLRFMVNIAPQTPDGKMAAFDDLQEAAEGIKRLGVLRMDVDDLGLLFKNGFSGQSTLARVASLSSSLAYFFEGWIGLLCRQFNDEYGAHGQTEPLYTIYSGGDDLFIVGTWQVMPRLAEQISSDLARYVGGEHIHVSGGLSLHGGKAPLYQTAKAAHEALEAAKDVDGKNAFCLFGQAYNWESFKNIAKTEQLLAKLVKDETVSRSLLRILLDLHTQYQETAKRYKTKDGRNGVIWGPHMWRGAYMLTRLIQRTEDKAAKQKLAILLQGLEKNLFVGLPKMALAARWADAETRKEQQERN